MPPSILLRLNGADQLFLFVVPDGTRFTDEASDFAVAASGAVACEDITLVMDDGTASFASVSHENVREGAGASSC